jgi:hypothetical protein
MPVDLWITCQELWKRHGKLAATLEYAWITKTVLSTPIHKFTTPFPQPLNNRLTTSSTRHGGGCSCYATKTCGLAAFFFVCIFFIFHY